jgi:hypothetical protein
VFRGDACCDQNGKRAIYREVKSLPATVNSINIVLWYGMLNDHVCTIADAFKAYLQVPLLADRPTYVVIPKLIWPSHWFRKFVRVACPLDKAMYGHQTSGDAWHDCFNGIVTLKMKLSGWKSTLHFGGSLI